MGISMSLTIADLVMETLLGDDENHVSGTSAKKYVDDLLLTVPREKIAKVLEIFNQYHAGMQFTLENDGRIPTVRKTDQTVITE